VIAISDTNGTTEIAKSARTPAVREIVFFECLERSTTTGNIAIESHGLKAIPEIRNMEAKINFLLG
jgi:hypothetical protein